MSYYEEAGYKGYDWTMPYALTFHHFGKQYNFLDTFPNWTSYRHDKKYVLIDSIILCIHPRQLNKSAAYCSRPRVAMARAPSLVWWPPMKPLA